MKPEEQLLSGLLDHIQIDETRKQEQIHQLMQEAAHMEPQQKKSLLAQILVQSGYLSRWMLIIQAAFLALGLLLLSGEEYSGIPLQAVLILVPFGGMILAALDAAEVLTDVGLGDRLDNFPAQLSGGEQQRVSIARALAKNPKLLLCDEPTGALDYNTGKAILKLLQNMCRERGMTVIVITHNQALAPMADRLIHIKNGQVSQMELNENPMSIDEIEW